MKWTTSADELKGIADTLKDVLTMCWLVFEHNKIRMVNVDPEKIATLFMEVMPPPDMYQCQTGFTFCTYIQLIYKVLRGTKAKDVATLCCDDGQNMTIEVKSENNQTKMKIRLNSLADPAPKFTFPVPIYDRQLEMNSASLYYILHDLGAVSRVFTLNIKSNVVTFESQDESGTTLAFCDEHRNLQYDFKGCFLTKYVEKFLKPKLTKHVQLRLKQGSPLSVVYQIAHGTLELAIAPL